MIDEKELLSMKIIHYFIMNHNYNPIVIKGIDGEVWLENKNKEYSIIRIVTKNIRNNEQYEYDILKTKHIARQIKRKTFDLSMNVLSIYVNTTEYVNVNNDDKKYISVLINNDDDFKDEEYINKYFKDIDEKYKYEKSGFDLITQLTYDIGNKKK